VADREVLLAFVLRAKDDAESVLVLRLVYLEKCCLVGVDSVTPRIFSNSTRVLMSKRRRQRKTSSSTVRGLSLI